MDRSKNRPGSLNSIAYRRWFVGTAGLALLGLGTFALSSRLIRADRTSGGLEISPALDERGDEPVAEASRIRSVFRLTNPHADPIRVTSIRTSCSCLATVGETGSMPELPLTLGPGEQTQIALETVVNARLGPKQSYSVVVSAERDGEPLPEAVGRLSFRVREVLKATPDSLVELSAPLDRPLRRSITLYTWGADEAEEPSVHSSNPERIRVEASQPADDSGAPPGATARSRLDVTIVPPPDGSGVEGTIDISIGGQLVETIPIQALFRAPFRLTPPRLLVDRSDGEPSTQNVFLEAEGISPDEWQVEPCSPGLLVEVEPFDQRTAVVRVTIDPDALGDDSDNPGVSLRAAGMDHAVSIPIELTGGR